MNTTEINATTQSLIVFRDRLTDRSDRETLADACNALDAFAKLTREHAALQAKHDELHRFASRGTSNA